MSFSESPIKVESGHNMSPLAKPCKESLSRTPTDPSQTKPGQLRRRPPTAGAFRTSSMELSSAADFRGIVPPTELPATLAGMICACSGQNPQHRTHCQKV
jgi:hypothetical protein